MVLGIRCCGRFGGHFRHPEPKAILTVRDSPDKYVDSWLTVARFIDDIGYRPYRWFVPAQQTEASLQYEYDGLDIISTLFRHYFDHCLRVSVLYRHAPNGVLFAVPMRIGCSSDAE